jgi:hypothetical protein
VGPHLFGLLVPLFDLPYQWHLAHALFVIIFIHNNLVTVSCCLFCLDGRLFSRCDWLLLFCCLRRFRGMHYLTVSFWLSINLFLYYEDILCFVAQNIMKNLLLNFHFFIWTPNIIHLYVPHT